MSKIRNMKTTYKIEPRVKKRWFKENDLYYDLVKETEEPEWHDPSFGNGGGNFISAKKLKTVFSSKDINEVLTVLNNIKK